MKLLKILDAAYLQTHDPDEIASKIRMVHWIKLADITDREFEKLFETPMKFGCILNNGEFLLQSSNWNWYLKHECCSASVVRRVYKGYNYYIIPSSEYKPGDEPPR